VRPAEANCTVVETGKSFPDCARRESVLTHREPTRHGYSYVDVRMAEVGPTHRASRGRQAARRVGNGALATEGSVRRADALGGDSKARTVRESCSAF